jgi:rhamnulokinase
VTGGAVAAVDLGASSGRVVVGHVGPHALRLDEVHRFTNGPISTRAGLRWPSDVLRTEILAGLRHAAARDPGIAGIGVDGWGVDYGLVDERGTLVAEPFAYRDGRTAVGVDRVHAIVAPAQLYRIGGLQHLRFNTLYQLVVDDPVMIEAAASMALVPDLVGMWLSGVVAAERTNASTTGLLDVRSDTWAWELIDDLGLPRRLFTHLADAGDRRGTILPAIADATGLSPDVAVTHVGSHDTASAVVGVPAVGDEFAYISCGTWGLVGVELERPILTEASRAANFTNERGVDGRVRYLRNVMGLWLLQESLRTWSAAGSAVELESLLGAAAAEPRGGPRFDPDDPAFLAPGDMPTRLVEAIEATGAKAPTTRPALVRSIIDSLADAFARAMEDAARLSGRSIDVVHLVGGGARNALLCQATADACGRPVVAGPVEATALGNVLVQARSHGWIEGDLEALRGLVAATQMLHRFEPQPNVVGGRYL